MEYKREDGITLLGVLIIFTAIVLAILVMALVVCMRAEESAEVINASGTMSENVNKTQIHKKKSNEIKNENTVKEQVAVSEKGDILGNDTEVEEQAGRITPIKMNVKDKETLQSGAELLHINDYEILVPDSFVEAGYEIIEEDDTNLRVKVNDGSYECVLIQLSDSYVMPTEQEIDAFYETEEYKAWYDEEIDYDDDEAVEKHYEKREEITINYCKGLGYTAQNSPDYILTNKELDEIVGKYYIDKNDSSSGSNNVFPGYCAYYNYDWGKVKIYTIPKYYNYSEFGESTSDFAICLYMFEYYDTEDRSIDNLSLNTI